MMEATGWCSVIDLSILVCAIHTRYDNFTLRVQRQLFEQYEQLPPQWKDRVEVLVLTDTKRLSIGAKRNVLANAAAGKYIVFVDDDDRIADGYVWRLLDATISNADVITFLAEVTLDGGPPKVCHYSKDWPHDYNTDGQYRRLPNHICCVQRRHALATGWGDLNYGEDAHYGPRLLPHLKSQFHINAVLYYYDFSSETSESKR